ncbi:MOB kinase activator-like 1 C [Tritrichomonas foetus]|uniref:MOB kinase activator-like 1 C n=1 Tax=Tritrichomonas foetus TaxID=1144522 RepID=A0A1J4JPP7_9EUKA|nr:MOB kinase activator-like 1 C [Tritrichomonas foetus]|eukprot:OHT00384.1 MOB kinase activator-like 1 C [Tritrichomonas foetus]
MLNKAFRQKSNGTILVHRNVSKGSRHYPLLQQKRATLNLGDFSESIKLPPETKIDDWLAANTIDFFNELLMISGNILEFCDINVCKSMTAGPKYQYLWQDSQKYPNPTNLPAKIYIHELFEWIDNLFEDETVFPEDPNVPFPKNFKDIIKRIFSRMFRVYAHIYYHHLDDVKKLDSEANFNTSFRHFYCFVNEFKLITTKELEPLKKIIQTF